MTQYAFGTGQLFARPVGGGAPLRFGALQDVSVDFSGDIKELFGQYQYALAVARGKTKIEWKAMTGNVDVEAFNQIFFNEPAGVTADAELKQVLNEAGAVPSSPGPYTISVTNAANFYADLGVKYVTTGAPLKQVTTGNEAQGSYSVSASGVYTFHADDADAAVLIDYLWEDSSGGSLQITNQLMGQAPSFELILSEIYDGKQFTLVLHKNVSEKLTMPFKQDDFMVSDISGRAFANDAGIIGRMTSNSITGGGA